MKRTTTLRLERFFMEEKKEIWRFIENYSDYQISNLGNIKSLKKEKIRYLKPSIGSNGYKSVVLCKNGKCKSFSVHKLMAICFLNHKPSGYKFVVNHKDFNKLNNNLDNLEIVTNRINSNKKHLKSSSKYTGVSWSKLHKKWVSNIRINGKLKFLGLFFNEKDASYAYDMELKKIQNEI